MKKILLIEDDPSFGYILTEYLSLHDYQVIWVKSGEEGLKVTENEVFDLGIFDIMLPDKNGYDVAMEIKRSHPYLPFIFLSAKSLKIDKLKGFKVGADDYVTKPVDEELLLAKINAIINRAQKTINFENIYNIGTYRFNFSTQQLIWNDETIHLTKRESELLRLLCHHQDQLLFRKKALREIWGATDEFSRNSMDVFISRLRKYLHKESGVQIINVHGKGFILSVE